MGYEIHITEAKDPEVKGTLYFAEDNEENWAIGIDVNEVIRNLEITYIVNELLRIEMLNK